MESKADAFAKGCDVSPVIVNGGESQGLKGLRVGGRTHTAIDTVMKREDDDS